MRKNTRIVSMAAAALLAVAPVAAGVVPAASVQASENAATTKQAAVISVVNKDGKELTKDNNSNSYSSTLNLSSNENSVSAITNRIIDNYQYDEPGGC